MGVLLIKPGVSFTGLAPAGLRLLGALDRVVRAQAFDLILTCGTDSHPPNDPHSRGCAFDVRTHNLTEEQKQYVLRAVLADLMEPDAVDPILPVSIGLATRYWYVQLENPGEITEHMHMQLRRGVNFPPAPANELSRA